MHRKAKYGGEVDSCGFNIESSVTMSFIWWEILGKEYFTSKLFAIFKVK